MGHEGFSPRRAVENLRRLESETGGPDGARRLAWSDEWEKARTLVRGLAHPDLEFERDRAGNDWYVLPGEGDLLVMGSHLDSVPAGGWLDGALGVIAGLEVLGGLAAGSRPSRPVAVVDWADEEGARFGRSLFGSSAFVGSLVADQLGDLVDRDGARALDLLPRFGVDPEALAGPDPRLPQIGEYLELHIEQGPILDRAGTPIAVVAGTTGIQRHRLTFTGQSDHAGPAPMDGRRDAFLAAAEAALAAERLAIDRGGRATTGRLDLDPGVPTAVPGTAVLYVDLRHDRDAELAGLTDAAMAAAEDAARRRGCGMSREEIWAIEPRPFDPGLVARAQAICTELSPDAPSPMVSGALHDAAEVAAVAPTVMLFCASRGGISHAPEEDSDEGVLELGIEALDRLARRLLAG